jgi:hypothetical protein
MSGCGWGVHDDKTLPKLYRFDQILPNTEIGRTKGAEIGIKPV